MVLALIRKTIIFLIIITFLCSIIPLVRGEVSVNVTIEVYSDGLAKVTYVVKVSDYPRDIILPLYASPIYLEAYAEETPLAVEHNETHVFFTAPAEEVILTYYTGGLTEKPGEEWFFNVNTPWPLAIILPENSLVFDIEPKDFELILVEDKPAFKFNQGNIKISYIITPEITPPKPKPEEYPLPSQYAIVALVLLIAAIILFIVLRGRGKKKEKVELDERDRRIIQVLSKYGEMTAYELMEKTRIPKTPLYRRLKRLEKLGYIESIVKAGRTVYRLKTS